MDVSMLNWFRLNAAVMTNSFLLRAAANLHIFSRFLFQVNFDPLTLGLSPNWSLTSFSTLKG